MAGIIKTKAGGWGGAAPPPSCKQNDLHNSSKLGWSHKKMGGECRGQGK